MKVENLGEVNEGGNTKQVLLKTPEDPPRYFVASTVVPFDTGKMETLVFASDETGYIESYAKLAGGIGMKRSEAIADLEKRLDDGNVSGEDSMDDYLEEMGGPMGGILGTLGMFKDSTLGLPVNAEPNDEDLE